MRACCAASASGADTWEGGFDGGGVLQGIETIVEDVLHVDPEWHRLGTLPGVQEGWAELKVKAAAAISECQARPRRHCQQRLTRCYHTRLTRFYHARNICYSHSTSTRALMG